MAQHNGFQTLFSIWSITGAIELGFMRGLFLWNTTTWVYNFQRWIYPVFPSTRLNAQILETQKSILLIPRFWPIFSFSFIFSVLSLQFKQCQFHLKGNIHVYNFHDEKYLKFCYLRVQILVEKLKDNLSSFDF